MEVSSIGVSLPGVLSHDRRRLVRSHALELSDLDLSPLAAGFGGLCVAFENDANAALEAEIAGLAGDTVLAIAVTNLRMAYDCDIMIGGYVGAFIEPYRAEIERAMAEVDMFEDDFSFLRIARHGFKSSAIGAAVHLRDEAVELL